MIAPLAVLAFLLELAALLILARWGWQAAGPPLWRWGLALGLPLVFSVVWGVFLSPRAPRPPSLGGQFSLKLALFAGVSLALWQMWGPLPAALFFAGGAVTSIPASRP